MINPSSSCSLTGVLFLTWYLPRGEPSAGVPAACMQHEASPLGLGKRLSWALLNIHWKDWRWSWNSNALATWCEELTHWKRPWCWERLKAGGEGYDRGWDGWMVSPTWWMRVWASSGSWWWTGRPGVLRSMGSQRAGQHWATELNWYFVNQTMWPHRKMSLKWTEKIFKVRKYPALYHFEMQCLQLEGL